MAGSILDLLVCIQIITIGFAAASGQLQAALADCNESIRLGSNSSNSLDSSGFVYLRLGRWDEAMTDSDAALRPDPRNAWAFFERGIANLRNGDRAGGDADISASRAIDPKGRWSSRASASSRNAAKLLNQKFGVFASGIGYSRSSGVPRAFR